MYKINASIVGSASLLQHAFGAQGMEDLQQAAKRQSGTPDYSLEWLGTMYTQDGYLVQPAVHIEGALLRASTNFKVKGRAGKSWRDAFQAYCYVSPDMLIHLRDGQPVPAPGPELSLNGNPYLSVSIMRVKVQRAAVARSRLLIAAGWQLDFTIEVIDDQLRPNVVETVLKEAGRAYGIGDYRPRYGRFNVTHFEVA